MARFANPLADFALAVATAVHDPGGSTAYTYDTATIGPLQVPQIDLSVATAATVYTDCSGWVNFVLASVAPLHAAVAAAERMLPLFNPPDPVEAYNPDDPAHPLRLTVHEAHWPWARAEVLTHLFDTAPDHGSDGFRQVTDFARLQAGDLIAWSLGIYSDLDNPDSGSQPDLVATANTGHTMVVAGGPVRVPMALAAGPTLSSEAVKVYAVPVVDSSSVPHFGPVPGFTQPLADDRDYTSLPPDLPDGGVGYKPGGLGTGTIWFAVNAAGEAIQYRVGETDSWYASPSTPTDPQADALVVIAAGRMTRQIELAGEMLGANGLLLVETYPNAAPGFGGAATVDARLTGAGGLLLGRQTGLVLDARSSFTGGITLADGSTLQINAAGAAGKGAITFAEDADATLILGAGLRLGNTITGFDAGDVIDLEDVQATGLTLTKAGALRVLQDGADPLVLHFAPGTVATGQAFAVADDGHGGTLITLRPTTADGPWA